jgi:hypothetical protein
MIKNWTPAEQRTLAETREIEIAPLRDDGKTYRAPTTIWCVVVDGALYIRSYHGSTAHWFQAALKQQAGRIIAGHVTKQVVFEAVSGTIDGEIDAAYRQKYHDSSYLDPMVGSEARAATLRVRPA